MRSFDKILLLNIASIWYETKVSSQKIKVLTSTIRIYVHGIISLLLELS